MEGSYLIKPVLKRVLFQNEPELPDDFVIPGIADIGTEGEEGVEYFYFRIMTPKRLSSILKEDRIFDGRATFIVNEFNIELIKKEINEILDDCIRLTWNEVAQSINRHLEWEYDNIQYETIEEAMNKINKSSR